ncbi:hormonally up-regulated neu tumor-associated kinase homolog A-like [Pelobates cultripes]|uniref:non-specific serine/threonine protein kinase n=1 Tax=Pelobates cultripes TaxID=61616 RepID=A0AAD1RD78_PELCU|nr:hormonally up-regulated neu tumor-associated kinase homolog A-like [Pelobates cultripes]
MIKHPNIVQLYETLETENSYYMVMELCLGGDLMDRICDKKRLDERDVRRYTRQLLSALDHLHRHGIVHRDLKIENFLLDENSNIKIVDFGLSNTVRLEGLSQELLNTQCGSPAYAAPELLANKKYGPKVDVWSIGVSMFAMLTGALPFTVEPFNIKQLHQKMINGEISPIPPDISAGAVHFIHTLLEPDPTKRPTVKEAMEDKWLNEGFIRKPLNSISYKNRLRPDELNSIVVNYINETMEIDIPDIVNTLVNNRPSPIMASYCLLLKKLMKHQREYKFVKNITTVQKHDNAQIPQTTDGTPNKLQTDKVILENKGKNVEEEKRSFCHGPIQEAEIAITLDDRKNVVEVISMLETLFFVCNSAGKEIVFLEPPNSSKDETLDANIKQPSLDFKDLYLKTSQEYHACNSERHNENCRSTNKVVAHERQQTHHSTVGSSHNSKPSPKPLTRLTSQSPPSQKQATRLRDLLKSVDNNIQPTYCQQQDKDCLKLVMIETFHHSPLPKLRQPALRENITKRISWVTSRHAKSGSPPFLINGSKPPVFPTSRQQTIMNFGGRRRRGEAAALSDPAPGNRLGRAKQPQEAPCLSPPWITRITQQTSLTAALSRPLLADLRCEGYADPRPRTQNWWRPHIQLAELWHKYFCSLPLRGIG